MHTAEDEGRTKAVRSRWGLIEWHLEKLAAIDVRVEIHLAPQECPVTTRFTDDVEHCSYDRARAHRLWQALRRIEPVFQTFRAGFRGKCSPVHFFWGGFDLAVSRFADALGGKSLADNIRVVGINPGPVGTDRHITLLKTRAKNQFGDESRYAEFQKGLPLGRPAHAREIGDLMAFLASDRSGYTSGVIFTVDGGIAAGWG